MTILTKPAQAGTLESGDVVVTVAPAEPGSGIEIGIESLVLLQYGESIRRTVLAVVQQYGVDGGRRIGRLAIGIFAADDLDLREFRSVQP